MRFWKWFSVLEELADHVAFLMERQRVLESRLSLFHQRLLEFEQKDRGVINRIGVTEDKSTPTRHTAYVPEKEPTP